MECDLHEHYFRKHSKFEDKAWVSSMPSFGNLLQMAILSYLFGFADMACYDWSWRDDKEADLVPEIN